MFIDLSRPVRRFGAVRPAVVFGYVLVALCTASNAAEDWPQWRGPERGGRAAASPALVDRLPATGLRAVWINTDLSAARGGGWSSPVVWRDRVFLFAHNKRKDKDSLETVYCCDAASGEVRWTSQQRSVFTRFPQSGTPAIADGRLYVLGAGLVVRCFDTETGDQLWSQQLPGKFTDEHHQASPLVIEGRVVVMAGRLAALDAKNGKLLWRAEDETQEAHGSPAVWRAEGRNWIVANLDRGETVLLDAESGAVQWREKTEVGSSSPVVVGNRMFTLGRSRKGGLRCYELSTGGAQHLWTYQNAADPGASPVVVDDHVYVVGERGLACVAVEDGKEQWLAELPLKQPRYTSLVAADGKLIYAFDDLLLIAAEPREHRLLWHGKLDREGRLAEEAALRQLLKLDDLPTTAEGAKEAERLWRQALGDSGALQCASPAVVDGRLFVRLKQGLACFDLRK